jgi:hypothetical protein
VRRRRERAIDGGASPLLAYFEDQPSLDSEKGVGGGEEGHKRAHTRAHTRDWKKRTEKGLQVSNSQTTQVPGPGGVRLEAEPAQGPGLASDSAEAPAPACTHVKGHRQFTRPDTPHAIQLPRCVYCASCPFCSEATRSARFCCAAALRCCTMGWGWGGAASYLDCSLDRGLLH